MTNLLMVDSAYPLSDPPKTDIVLVYIGGDTPHVWTSAESKAQPARYRLPTFVRSNPTAANVVTDANAALAWLRGNFVPAGSAVCLDLETAVDVSYVNSFGALLHDAGYKVLPYGSSGSLFKNPAIDGYFVAEPHATAIDPRSVATQFEYEGSYDLSWVLPTVDLWDTQPPAPKPNPTPTPTPAPTPPGDDVVLPLLNDQTPGGSLWTKSLQSILKEKFGQTIIGVVDGNYGTDTVTAVENVQRFFKIAVDGQCGPATWPIILGL